MSKPTYTVKPTWLLAIERPERPVQLIVLPSLSDALAAARVDAAWLRGIGSVRISPLLYVDSAAEPQKG